MSRLRIEALSTRIGAIPLKRPFITSRRRTESVTVVTVELRLAGGATGIGTAAETFAVTGESAASMAAALDGPIAAALTGAERSLTGHAEAIAASCASNTSAKAAAEIALHDAWARGLGVPLATALGGDPAAELRTDMTVSLQDPATMAADAVAAAEDGYRTLKIKLGGDWSADMDRLRAVNEAVPEASLRLDANQGWTVKDAIRAIRRIEDEGFPVELVEQPVHREDLHGLRQVTAAVMTPVMADEALTSPADALRLAGMRAADLFNIKLAKCGGIRQALAIADIAHAAGIPCMVGAMMEPRVSITAAAHLAAAHLAITLIDLDPAEWMAENGPAGGYTMHGSRMVLPSAPGLGFQAGRSSSGRNAPERDTERTTP
ncbi:dipeptide epimerase [Sediminivirga luteola]|uniref:Dipeptide epimerase n=1 Tax=Sediminivirga luteola TaxID=1774748 RepID=A0A8J2XLF8_9MICO|nr:dipeptide epimerase [Sediminivirga luteola]GGA22173.1 dipeptide epimerase [Sediminivirga luteola]